MKQHDALDDFPLPLADLSNLLPATLPLRPLPLIARTDELTTPLIYGTTHRSAFRRQTVKDKVQSSCFAGPDPVMHVEHPPHMLERVDGSVLPSGDGMVGERLMDKVVKRKFRPVVELPGKGQRRTLIPI
jgi:hypothetical protein